MNWVSTISERKFQSTSPLRRPRELLSSIILLLPTVTGGDASEVSEGAKVTISAVAAADDTEADVGTEMTATPLELAIVLLGAIKVTGRVAVAGGGDDTALAHDVSGFVIPPRLFKLTVDFTLLTPPMTVEVSDTDPVDRGKVG